MKIKESSNKEQNYYLCHAGVHQTIFLFSFMPNLVLGKSVSAGNQQDTDSNQAGSMFLLAYCKTWETALRPVYILLL